MVNKITLAILYLLGEHPQLTAMMMAHRINKDHRFGEIRAKWRHPVTTQQVYAAMSGLRSKHSVERTFIEPAEGKIGSNKPYKLTRFGRERLAQMIVVPDKVVERSAETVDHPAHYGGGDNPYEAIKVIEAWGLDFCLGNTVKYISRAGHKPLEPALDGIIEGPDLNAAAIQDLRKARWYLDRRIRQLEKLDG